MTTVRVVIPAVVDVDSPSSLPGLTRQSITLTNEVFFDGCAGQARACDPSRMTTARIRRGGVGTGNIEFVVHGFRARQQVDEADLLAPRNDEDEDALDAGVMS
jgi:hypothetical protein